MKKIDKKFILGFIFGGIILGVSGVCAATILSSKDVTYDNTSSKLNSTNMQDAIDELVERTNSHCPDGYICTEKPKLCQRATTLHTETCSQTSTSSYCSGDGYTSDGTMGTTTITYGSLGTSGTLSTGDAFDCDVNGDGTYDAATERFYYVSDMTNGVTTDSNTVVLIYYNNVSGGVPSNSTAYAYNTDDSGYLGPQKAIAQLPTTTQWSNVSLTSTTRDITDEVSTTRVSGFSYDGYAARLLTYQEVNTGCYDGTTAINSTGGLSNKCKFLMENTKYSNSTLKTFGGWLETPDSSRSINAWYVRGYNSSVYSMNIFGTGGTGVRPAIEVLKSNISY